MEKLCSWIAHCISSIHFSALVNGSPTGFFSSSCGLRQSDPLSPSLFVIVMEALSKMITTTVDRGFLSSFFVVSRPLAVTISHLLFVDATLVFCGANPNHLCHLRVLLLFFEAVSSLKVNLAKFVLVLVGNVDNMGELTDIFGGTTSLAMKYLGLLQGASYKAKSIWDVIVEKMERRLASWKRMYLFKGGKVNISYLRTFCPSSPSLLVWLIALRSSNETFYGAGLVKNLNITLLVGLRFAPRSLQGGWVSVT
jgi:hypothetical protein